MQIFLCEYFCADIFVRIFLCEYFDTNNFMRIFNTAKETQVDTKKSDEEALPDSK